MEPFEDNPEDIIGKAQRGLELDDLELADRTGLARQRLRAARRADLDRDLIDHLAPHLRLSAAALRERLDGLLPPHTQLGPHLRQIVSTWGDMRVNAWLLVACDSKQALLFDTGAEFEPLQTACHEMAVQLGKLILTHTHRDHVALLDKLCSEFPALTIHAPANEPLAGASLVQDGDELNWGDWTLRAMATPGHSAGGTSYAIYPCGSTQPQQPAAVIVGDALFAGSIGGIRANLTGLTLRETYAHALTCIRSQLLSFSEDTLLLPGHGPATTVGWELAHNPFFAT